MRNEGYQQLFDALFQSQMEPTSVEVDELTQNKQSQTDEMKEVLGIKGTGFSTGMDAMREAFTATHNKKKRQPGYVPYDPNPGF